MRRDVGQGAGERHTQHHALRTARATCALRRNWDTVAPPGFLCSIDFCEAEVAAFGGQWAVEAEYDQSVNFRFPT